MSLHSVRVWDLPTRVFHWALVLAVAGLVITAEIGGNALMWHFRLGYLMLCLLLFRLVWGVVGGYWSRFSSFLPSPHSLARYLRGQGDLHDSVGHNPLGALSVLALLAVLFLHAAFGLASDDEIASAGPLASKLPGAWVSMATFLHKEVSIVVLGGLVVLHLCAISWYWLRKRENLVQPMWTGNKQLSTMAPDSRDDARSRIFALLVFAICAGVVYGGLQWAG